MTLKRNHARQQPPQHTPNDKRLNYFTKGPTLQTWLTGNWGGLTKLLSGESSPTRLNMLLQLHTEDGEHSVGWHADDEHLFQGKHHDCRIMVCLKMTGLTPDCMVQPRNKDGACAFFVYNQRHSLTCWWYFWSVCAGRIIQEHNMIIYDYTRTLNRLMYKG